MKTSTSPGDGHHLIGRVSRSTGLSVDTLRYYERIGLLPPVMRTSSGIRTYTDEDIARLGFIRRAQGMGFSLAEIGTLLKMRDDPQNARSSVRAITRAKLEEVETRLQELTTLRDELRQLVESCHGTDEGCPIIDAIDQGDPKAMT